MSYMVAGYLIIWLASFAFIFSMVRRQRQLQQEVAVLRELVDQQEDRA